MASIIRDIFKVRHEIYEGFSLKKNGKMLREEGVSSKGTTVNAKSQSKILQNAFQELRGQCGWNTES